MSLPVAASQAVLRDNKHPSVLRGTNRHNENIASWLANRLLTQNTSAVRLSFLRTTYRAESKFAELTLSANHKYSFTKRSMLF